jgi:hypothetical protein
MDDIDLFSCPGQGRGSNDINNKKREDILCILHDPPAEYMRDERWNRLCTAWRLFLRELCTHEYDSVSVVKQGGRGKNYDFDIKYILAGKIVQTVKAEFKHNAKTIDSLPQYFSPADNKPYMPTSYAEFYYTHYLGRVCELYGLEKPDRAAYLKYVYSDNYSRLPVFTVLYDFDKAGHDDNFEKRCILVKESIAAYLEMHKNDLNMAELSKDIRDRQQGKTFILWDLNTFRAETIREDEMAIVSTQGVKNGNVLVAVSRAGTKHNMLLRWKNHLGVLYPAWQISLAR